MDVTELFKDHTTTSVVEATPDFVELPHRHGNGGHHAGNGVSKCNEEGGYRCEEVKVGKFSVELYPMQLKTFIITLQ